MGGTNPRKGLSHFVSMRANYSKREHCSKENESRPVSWNTAFGHCHIEVINIQSMKIAFLPSQGRKHLPFSLSSKEVFLPFLCPSLCHKQGHQIQRREEKQASESQIFPYSLQVARALPVLGLVGWWKKGRSSN